MTVDRSELADILAEATGWSVTADPHRLTLTNDDPSQVVIWTVTDGELAQLRYGANVGAKSFGGRRSADLGVLCLPVMEAIGPFEGSRGVMRGTDLRIIE